MEDGAHLMVMVMPERLSWIPVCLWWSWWSLWTSSRLGEERRNESEKRKVEVKIQIQFFSYFIFVFPTTSTMTARRIVSSSLRGTATPQALRTAVISEMVNKNLRFFRIRLRKRG